MTSNPHPTTGVVLDALGCSLRHGTPTGRLKVLAAALGAYTAGLGLVLVVGVYGLAGFPALVGDGLAAPLGFRLPLLETLALVVLHGCVVFFVAHCVTVRLLRSPGAKLVISSIAAALGVVLYLGALFPQLGLELLPVVPADVTARAAVLVDALSLLPACLLAALLAAVVSDRAHQGPADWLALRELEPHLRDIVLRSSGGPLRRRIRRLLGRITHADVQAILAAHAGYREQAARAAAAEAGQIAADVERERAAALRRAMAGLAAEMRHGAFADLAARLARETQLRAEAERRLADAEARCRRLDETRRRSVPNGQEENNNLRHRLHDLRSRLEEAWKGRVARVGDPGERRPPGGMAH